MLLGYREVHHKDLECLISVCVLHSSNEIKNSKISKIVTKSPVSGDANWNLEYLFRS